LPKETTGESEKRCKVNYYILFTVGHAVAQLVEALRQKVAVSIPDGDVRFVH
jgi:hypothetical protein